MAVTTREELKEYCLRSLGKPVIQINVAPSQVEDRIDEALQLYHEIHVDATDETWLAYKLTQEDKDNGYLTMDDDVISVVQMINIGNYIHNSDMFSYQHQVKLQNLSPFMTLDMTNYFMTMSNLNETMAMTNPNERIKFTRHANKLDIYQDIYDLPVDTVIALRVFKTLDPESHKKIYNDMWLKEYCTALIKRQWGANMKKHGEVQLLGGVTVNGQQFYDEAQEEIQRLKEELDDKWSEPIDFFMG